MHVTSAADAVLQTLRGAAKNRSYLNKAKGVRDVLYSAAIGVYWNQPKQSPKGLQRP